ncbi:hypothetical protein HK096_000397, partial [Nowakowskiella sp. JEL0078]
MPTQDDTQLIVPSHSLQPLQQLPSTHPTPSTHSIIKKISNPSRCLYRTTSETSKHTPTPSLTKPKPDLVYRKVKSEGEPTNKKVKLEPKIVHTPAIVDVMDLVGSAFDEADQLKKQRDIQEEEARKARILKLEIERARHESREQVSSYRREHEWDYEGTPKSHYDPRIKYRKFNNNILRFKMSDRSIYVSETELREYKIRETMRLSNELDNTIWMDMAKQGLLMKAFEETVGREASGPMNGGEGELYVRVVADREIYIGEYFAMLEKEF